MMWCGHGGTAVYSHHVDTAQVSAHAPLTFGHETAIGEKNMNTGNEQAIK